MHAKDHIYPPRWIIPHLRALHCGHWHTLQVQTVAIELWLGGGGLSPVFLTMFGSEWYLKMGRHLPVVPFFFDKIRFFVSNMFSSLHTF